MFIVATVKMRLLRVLVPIEQCG